MTTSWPTEEIVKVLSKAFSPELQSFAKRSGNRNSADGPNTTIDILMTFDKHGISSHPNHISLYQGARAWISALMAGRAGWKCPVEIYTLTSINVLRKYITFFDAPLSLLLGGLRGASTRNKRKGQDPPGLVFISGFAEWRKGQDAMIDGHASQMVWFRWGWISIGRYMIVNDLKRERIP